MCTTLQRYLNIRVRNDLLYSSKSFDYRKMDPYLKVKLGTFCQQSKVAKDQGKNPTWQDVTILIRLFIFVSIQCLTFTKKYEEELIIECWDKDTASSDDLVNTL